MAEPLKLEPKSRPYEPLDLTMFYVEAGQVYQPVQCTEYKEPTFYDCDRMRRDHQKLLCEPRDEPEVEEMDLIEELPTHNSDENCITNLESRNF